MTKDEIIDMAREAGFERLGHDDCDYVCYPDEIEAFTKLIAEKEREAIEKRVMELDETMATRANVINKAIRAKGQE